MSVETEEMRGTRSMLRGEQVGCGLTDNGPRFKIAKASVTPDAQTVVRRATRTYAHAHKTCQ